MSILAIAISLLLLTLLAYRGISILLLAPGMAYAVLTAVFSSTGNTR